MKQDKSRLDLSEKHPEKKVEMMRAYEKWAEGVRVVSREVHERRKYII